MEERRASRERTARVLGVAAGLACAAAASFAIHWPAPAVSVALGFAVYWVARGGDRRGGGR